MANTASGASRAPRPAPQPPNDKGASGAASPKNSGRRSAAAAKPDVEAIMAGIRKTLRERADEGGLTEREFQARHWQRMLRPLKGLDEDFADRFRSRDPSRWNVALDGADFHGGASGSARFFRRLLRPLARLLVDLSPAARQAARQAEINEYYRRLLWATNRDLEQTRLELDLLKRELRRFGVQAEFSFKAPPASADEASSAPRGGGRGEDRGAGDRGRGERGRGDRGRGERGKGERSGGDRGRGDRGKGERGKGERGRGDRGRGERGRGERGRDDRGRGERGGSEQRSSGDGRRGSGGGSGRSSGGRRRGSGSGSGRGGGRDASGSGGAVGR